MLKLTQLLQIKLKFYLFDRRQLLVKILLILAFSEIISSNSIAKGFENSVNISAEELKDSVVSRAGLIINQPQNVTVSSTLICTSGSVTFQATCSNTNYVAWYTTLTGGNIIGIGTPFISEISNTTTYYAACSDGVNESVRVAAPKVNIERITPFYADFTASSDDERFISRNNQWFIDRGWFLRDVDNVRTVYADYLGGSWALRDGGIVSSSYSTQFNGVANDWIWTPLIKPIEVLSVLSWNAQAIFPDRRDGYEVRLMLAESGPPTGGPGQIGNQITNSILLFSTVEENTNFTYREIDLSAYAGKSFYIGFRNNSQYKGQLLIDNILVQRRKPILSILNLTPKVCEGSNITLTASCDRGTVNWFDAGGSNLQSTGTSFSTPIISKDITYKVQCKETECSKSDFIDVNVSVILKPVLTNNSPICSGSKLTFSTSTSFVNYSWKGPNGFTSTQQNPEIAVANTDANGVYTLTIVGGDCLFSPVTTSVTVYPIPAIPTLISADKSIICKGNSVTLNATCSNSSEVLWYSLTSPNDPLGKGSPFSHTPQGSISYTVACSKDNCESPRVSLPRISVESNMIFSENFSRDPFPYGWFLRDVDNNPFPNFQVPPPSWYHNDFEESAYSTSFTNPPAQADDWMWTPLIGPLPSNSKLRWDAKSVSSPRESYEVRIMNSVDGPPTGGKLDLGNQVSNSTKVFSIPGENNFWTTREVDLSTYTGKSIYIGFRQNSFNKVILSIDNIIVEKKVSSPQTSNTNNMICAGTTKSLQATCESGVVKWYNEADALVSTGNNYTTPILNSNTVYNVRCEETDCLTSEFLKISISVQSLPVPSIVNNDPCIGDVLELSTSQYDSYLWKGPNNFSSSSQTPSIINTTNLSSGIYSLTVTLNGCIGTSTANIIITEPSLPSSVSADKAVICLGDNIQLTASCGNMNENIYWYTSLTGGISIGSGTPFIHKPLENTTYFASCRINECESVRLSTQLVTVEKPLPTPTLLTTNTSICANNNLSLNVSCSRGNAKWYNEANANALIFTGNNYTTPILNSNTTYYVRCEETDCLKSEFLNVLVSVTPLPIISTKASVCTGETLTLNTSTYESYEWSGPNDFKSTLQNPQIQNVSQVNQGIYILSVLTGACTLVATTNIEVISPPYSPSDVKVDNRILCEGSPVVLEASCLNQNQVIWYASTSGGTSLGTGSPFTVTTSFSEQIYYAACSNGVCESNRIPTPALTIERRYVLSENFDTDPFIRGWVNDGAFWSPFTKLIVFDTFRNSSSKIQIYTKTSEPLRAGSYLQFNARISMRSFQSTAKISVKKEINGVFGEELYSSRIWDGQNIIDLSQFTNESIYVVFTYESEADIFGFPPRNEPLFIDDVIISQKNPEISIKTPSPTLCNETNTILSATCTEGGIVKWYNSSGQKLLAQGNLFRTPLLFENTQYKARCEKSNCLQSSFSEINISVINASIKHNSPICEGMTLNLSTDESGSFSWSGPNGFSSTSSNPVIDNITSLSAGTYTLTFTNGVCDATSTAQIIVNPTPKSPLDVSVNKNNICLGATVKLEAQCENGSDVKWYTLANDVNAVYTGSPFLTNPESTTEYYVSCKSLNCESVRLKTEKIIVNDNVQEIIFSERFDTNPFDNGWFIRDVDNNNGVIIPFLSTWFFNLAGGNNYAMSNSLYTPPAQSDDWLWTPLIGEIKSNTVLEWEGITFDPDRRDGYEVRIMKLSDGSPTGGKGVIGNQLINSAVVFSTPAENTTWTKHRVDLSAFQNESVYIGFRNNSFDKFRLGIDNILVSNRSAYTNLAVPSNLTKNIAACKNKDLILTATCDKGDVKWYDVSEKNLLYVGREFITDKILDNTVYKVQCFQSLCEQSDFEEIKITVNSTNIVSNSPVCEGSILSLSTSNADTYIWEGPNGFSSTIQNPQIPNVSSLNQGIYTVTVTRADGCISTLTTAVTLNTTAAIPNITGTTNLTCAVTSVSRTASGGATYSWSGPNSFMASTAEATITAAGTYTVTVTSAANGCTATATTEVTLDTTAPMPSITGTTNLTCAVTSVSRTASGGATYSWSGPNMFTAKTAEVMITTAGTYTVTVTGTNGCTATATTEVTLDATAPMPSIMGTTNLTCAVTTISRTASGGATYSWSGPNMFTANTSEVMITTAGTYTVTVTGRNGCTATATTAVTLDATAPLPSITGTTNLTCEVTSVNRTASGGATYSWSGPNMFTANTAEVMITAAGTFTVTVTSAANGCTATATTVITSDTSIDRPVVTTFSPVTGAGGTVVCTPNNLTLTATCTTGTVLWSDNSTGTSLTLSTVGTYSISAKCLLNSCVSDASDAVSLEIKALPNVTATNTGPYTVGQTISLFGNGGETYDWTGPNNFSSTLSTPTIPNTLTTNGGVYTLTVIGASGCSAQATTNVVINGVDPCDPSRIVDYLYVKAGNPHQPLFNLTDGMTIKQLPDEVSILVTPSLCSSVTIECFEMKIHGPGLSWIILQNVAPNALFDNAGSSIAGRNFLPGNYTLTVTGYAQDFKGGGITYGPKVIRFTIVGNLAAINAPTLSKTNLCAGSTVDVSFNTSGNFNGGNEFRVELSDSSGSFAAPVLIGMSNGIGTLNCTIPPNTPEGSRYLVRVVSSNPILVSSPAISRVIIHPYNYNLVSPTNDLTGTKTKKAVTSINASNKVTTPASVTYQAGTAVLLTPGFESGGVFKAEIRGCDN